jgi:hypothetical protein
MTPEQMRDDLERAISERLAARRAESVRRAQNLRELRAFRQSARDAGLAQRHAAKLARTSPTITSEDTP